MVEKYWEGNFNVKIWCNNNEREMLIWNIGRIIMTGKCEWEILVEWNWQGNVNMKYWCDNNEREMWIWNIGGIIMKGKYEYEILVG